MDSLTAQIIIDILAHEMELNPQGEQANIWVRSQTRKIPEGAGIYITVGMRDAPKVISSNMVLDTREVVIPDEPSQYETYQITSAVIAEAIQVDIMSRDNSALMRQWEVITAMVSIYAQQKQEENSFKIFRQPFGFLNISSAEGGSNLNRFTITIPTFVCYKKERLLTPTGGEYYDDFTTRVDDAKTIGEPDGLFDFRITPEGIQQ